MPNPAAPTAQVRQQRWSGGEYDPRLTKLEADLARLVD
jgi:hypothetical protein